VKSGAVVPSGNIVLLVRTMVGLLLVKGDFIRHR
jgi:hypothetical protein